MHVGGAEAPECALILGWLQFLGSAGFSWHGGGGGGGGRVGFVVVVLIAVLCACSLVELCSVSRTSFLLELSVALCCSPEAAGALQVCL